MNWWNYKDVNTWWLSDINEKFWSVLCDRIVLILISNKQNSFFEISKKNDEMERWKNFSILLLEPKKRGENQDIKGRMI